MEEASKISVTKFAQREQSASHKLEIRGNLRVEPIRVVRTERRGRERLLDVIADEKMSIAGFDLRETHEGIAGDHVNFSADEIIVGRIDPVARAAGCWIRTATSDAARLVKAVVRVRKEKRVPFNRQAQSRHRLALE